MSTLEREVIEKFHQLDEAAQRRVRELIINATGTTAVTIFDFEAWVADIEAMRQEIRASHGDQLPDIHVVDMLRGIRDGEDE